jgi:hypothetical protein
MYKIVDLGAGTNWSTALIDELDASGFESAPRCNPPAIALHNGKPQPNGKVKAGAPVQGPLVGEV